MDLDRELYLYYVKAPRTQTAAIALVIRPYGAPVSSRPKPVVNLGPVHGRVLLVMIRSELVGVADSEEGLLIHWAAPKVPANGHP